ncbi:hypothetical protein P3521_03580 [Vibrio parahaemolyticus]|nr:hypothetical protein [Vibrio parahaemolyticus]MDF4668682.1 hypothetical protein [Vibrio parahaemolyticus]HAV1412768.1 hypothetical protein [Vibrio parahaemolyticus]HAV2004852.1 hypothetical protein [Vibrio parahaemolyticus]
MSDDKKRDTDFPKLVSELDGGVIANVVGLAMSNVARAVCAADKIGEVTLKFKLKTFGSNADMVSITTQMNVNEPKVNYGSKKEDFKYESVAHVGWGGKLTYDKPKEDVNGQKQLGLVEDQKLREVR